MSSKQISIEKQTNELFKSRYLKECNRVNRFMIWLMVVQWFAGIAFAVFYSPVTWIGQSYSVHVHVWASVLLGGAISGFSILWTKTFPESVHTRHVNAIAQMLWSALLIHLTGGRIETHFHVFASLAILSIYRDWKILITATIVVAVDHFIRGVFYPLSAFGIVTESPYRWIEHAAWVIFEVSFLAPGCMRLRNEIRELCVRQTEIEQAKKSVEKKVQERTSELTTANQRLAQKTQEAEKLALVARYTDNAVVITDENSRIEWVNEGFTRITGYSLEEVKNRKSDFQHGPVTDRKTLNRMRSAIENRNGFDAEIINYRKNGEPYWLAIEARPIPDEHGNISQFIAIQSDVTERKHMEMSLAATEQRLRSLVNNVPGAFYRCQTDDDRTMIFMSNAIEEIAGYSPGDFVAERSICKADIVHPEDKQLFTTAINRAIADQGDYEIEYRIIGRNQNIKWVWERGQCLLADGTKVLDGMIFDVTDRKLSEAEIASKGQVIEESLNEIFIFDATSLKFLYANRGGRSNIGYSLEELQELTPLDIKPDFSMDSFRQMVRPLQSGEKQQILFQTVHRRKDGSSYVAEIRLQQSRYQNRDVFLAMILDVTERVEAENRNSQLQRELVDASRKAGMADVATGVLHNVGNILNSVNISAALIRKKFQNSALSNLEKASDLISAHETDFEQFVATDDRGKKLPNYIVLVTDALKREREQIDVEFDDLAKNVEHIKDIVSVQQSMAKSSGLQQLLSAAELVNDSLTANKGTLLNHRVAISTDIEQRLPQLVSDKHKILQILINLIGNAKDAVVECKTTKPEIKITVRRVDDGILFEVADNGIGIEKERLDQIFQHGFTSKESGHGFGLHSSANSATELGGNLTVSSSGIGQGAAFQLWLPVNQSEPGQNAAPLSLLTQFSEASGYGKQAVVCPTQNRSSI